MIFTIFIYMCMPIVCFMLFLCYQHYQVIYNLYRLGIFSKCFTIQNFKKITNTFYSMLRTSFYFILQKYFVQHVVEIGPNLYEIKCVLNNKLHILRYHMKHEYNTVLQITDEEMKDVTSEIEPYINGYDLNLIYMSPSDFNTNKIFIERFDGENDIFEKKDKIIMKYKEN